MLKGLPCKLSLAHMRKRKREPFSNYENHYIVFYGLQFNFSLFLSKSQQSFSYLIIFNFLIFLYKKVVTIIIVTTF